MREDRNLVEGSSERRGFLRVPFETELEITSREDGTTVRSTSSKDISLKGIYCLTEEPFPKDTPCSIRLHVSGTRSKLWLELEGHVVRTDDTGMALSFDAMELDVFIHLKNILYYNSGEPERIDEEIMRFNENET